jgi:guanylate kinase
MKNRLIFLIDGASGTGKSDLVEYAASSAPGTCVLMKVTTRPRRRTERSGWLDLEFVSLDLFWSLNLDYRYRYGAFDYGFSKTHLADLCRVCRTVFVIIRSVPIMRQVRQDFSDYTVVTVFVHTERKRIAERLRREGGSPQEVEYRLARVVETYEDYLQNASFYDEILANNSDKPSYQRSIAELMEKYLPEARLSAPCKRP